MDTATSLLPLAEQLHNPYWEMVREQVGPSGIRGTRTVGSMRAYRDIICQLDVARWMDEAAKRPLLTGRYAWTITDPASVAFVAEHAGGRLVDPMAGTGYWAWLLNCLGVDTVACDLNPPADWSATNHYHKQTSAFVPVLQADAVDAVKVHSDRTLLLSWPPYDGPIGNMVVRHYRGARIIYIGESAGGCCGTDSMFDTLDRNWQVTAEHMPVQWDGIHDYITVYDRKES